MKSIITTLLIALLGFYASVAWAQQPAETRSTMNEQRTTESTVEPVHEARPRAEVSPASRTRSPTLPRSTDVEHPTKPAALCACVDLGNHA
ncbi:hypothetical protein [Piscinibacter sp.]|uniref:hypothetical protein n=1 Tax=Piscinibacter sp. TaxID=1903157 RepID=UPI002C406D86|nr:hypothetical protein [Albitalea sp.]HUG24988.1 hypothetical protein [Albitalea sp.]